MLEPLPESTADLLTWDWNQFEPLANELLARPLSAANSAEWLQDWSNWGAYLLELYNRLYLATSQDTQDFAAEQAYTRYVEQIYPASLAADQALKQKFIASGLEPAGFAVALRNLRAEMALYREQNLPLLSEEQKLCNEYDKITGVQTVLWDGEERTIAQLFTVYQETDRDRREQAWRLAAERQLYDRPALNELWARMLGVRQQLAVQTDLPDYRAYRWQQLLRFDYSPHDCHLFHEAIETEVVPVARQIYERRRQQLGVSVLRPWDLDVDVLGRAPLRPYQNITELKSRTAAIFHQVDDQLGAHFDTIVAEGLLDLENRKDKAPGGYCTDFPVVRRPFIFMNAVGVHNDVQTLLHEGGHAFHVFESHAIHLLQLLQVPMEFAEVASMSMELLASPYLASTGGFYSAADAARARVEHLENSLLFWPYMAVVDAFQHWAYENPAAAAEAENCDAAWTDLWQRFMPGVDWGGLEDVQATGWQRKLHIFTVPFYYVEYGLAQLGAVQVWRNALSDQAGAVARYRQALALGGSVPLRQLYQAAGARLAFDCAALAEAVSLMKSKVEELS